MQVATKHTKAAMKLLHDMAVELEMAFSSVGPRDYCVEIVAKDARRLLARYERLRAKLKTP